MTEEDLKQIRNCVKETIREMFPKWVFEVSMCDRMGIDEALIFLRGMGIFISKKYLYRLAQEKNIPYQKIARKLVFSKKELIA